MVRSMPRSKRNPDLANLIGARLKELRARTSYTQEALAWACDLDKGYLSHVESGENLPSVAVLATLAEHLGVGLVDVVAVDPTDAGAELLIAVRRGDRKAVHECLRRLGLE
jgi:transcriptional regulator with XRE-family HTH domain